MISTHNLALAQNYNKSAYVSEINSTNQINLIKDSIQQHYLTQNENGTFSISPIAYTLYPEKAMNTITQGMNSMNKAILSGNIKFKMETINNTKEIKVTYENQNALLNNFSNKNIQGNAFMSNYTFLHTYCYDFNYSWAGFYCDVNVNGCYILANELNIAIYAAGGVGSVAGITGDIPVAAGCAADAVYAVAMQSALNSGAETGAGATIDAWGSPMGSCVIYGASVN